MPMCERWLPSHSSDMPDQLSTALVLVGLLDAAILYGRLMSRRGRERRIQARLDDAAHLYGLVRVTLADRRAAGQG
jgi:hypothetical protein